MPRGKDITPEQKDLIMRHLCHGKSNAISARELANMTGLRSDRTDILVRSIMSTLIEEEGLAIGSCGRGFYLVETEEELAGVIANIEVRIRGMQDRVKMLKKNWESIQAEKESLGRGKK